MPVPSSDNCMVVWDVVLVLTWKFEVGKALVQQWWEL